LPLNMPMLVGRRMSPAIGDTVTVNVSGETFTGVVYYVWDCASRVTCDWASIQCPDGHIAGGPIVREEI